MTDKTNFYEDIPEFSDFRLVSDGARYQPVPNDWWIIAGDIRNSTEAIEKGQYKEVNMAGASIIAAVSNLFREFGPLPFSFGGDGAFVLVPNHKTSEIRNALDFCRSAVRDSFGLDMRTGMIRMGEIRENGYEVRVAKLKLSDTISQTLFWGNGLSYADSRIKDENPVKNTGESFANLEGLECRWQEIPPDQDEISSYIIQARGNSDRKNSEIYERCLRKIEDVYGSLNERNPITEKKLKFKKNFDKLSVEWKIRTWKPTLVKRLKYGFKLGFQLMTGKYLMARKITTKYTDWGRYKSDLIQHVDFRKFSEGLRFVAAGTVGEREEMELFLEDEFQQGNMYYGVHNSKSLIITCYVTNYHKEHIHFVDGVDGGYAMAAKKMKLQMNQPGSFSGQSVH